MIFTILAAIVLFLLVVLCLIWFVLFTPHDRHIITQKPLKFESSNGTRTYNMHVPKNIDDQTKVVFVFDGFGGNGKRVAYYSGLHNVASNSIVVYPDPITPNPGQTSGWNAGFCCGSGWVQKVDDVGFVTGLAHQISQKYGLMTDQFYAVGFSNGAFLTQRLAAEVPEKVIAAVSFAGTIGKTTQRLEPKAPVPILLIHGRNDSVVPLNGGARASDPDFVWLSHDETVQSWQSINAEKEPVEIYLHDGGHIWPGWRTFNVWHRRTDGSKRAVDFITSITPNLQ